MDNDVLELSLCVLVVLVGVWQYVVNWDRVIEEVGKDGERFSHAPLCDRGERDCPAHRGAGAGGVVEGKEIKMKRRQK